MAESGAVDAAILAALRADAALLAACPGGVFYAIAPPGVINVVIVDRLTAAGDDTTFRVVASESYLYLVKAVILSSSSDAARQAAARIRAVLSGAELAPAGYASQRPIVEVEPIRSVEVDEINPDRRVQHWGGQYAVTVEPIA